MDKYDREIQKLQKVLGDLDDQEERIKKKQAKRKKIKDLKKEILKKKFRPINEIGRSLSQTGENIGKSLKLNDPKGNIKSLDQVIKDLPQ